MKKLLLSLLITLALFGCSIKSDNADNMQNSVEPEINSGIPQNEVDYCSRYPHVEELILQIKEKHLFYPSDIMVNLTENYVRWVADCGVGIDFDIYSDEDQEVYVKQHSIYKGNLTEIDENIYSCKGEFMPTMLSKNSPISEDVDFYLILKDEKAFIILEETSIEELKEYTSNAYYTLVKFDE